MPGRGVIRRTKRKRDPDWIIGMMERRALDYLEKELQLNIDSPGNAQEVSRILRAIKEFKPSDPAASQPANDRAALQRQFRFDAGVEDQRGGAAGEAEPRGDPEA